MRLRRCTIQGLALILLTGLSACQSPSSNPQGSSTHRAWDTPQPAEPAPSDATSDDRAATASADTASPSERSTPPPPRIRAEDILMTVNGRPITRTDFIEKLIESHGLALAEQMILTTAARQRAEELNLTVTDQDIRRAHEDALRRLAMPLNPEPDAPLDEKTLAQARLLLEEFLLAKNISRLEWNMRMEQNAILRKIAEAEAAQMPITEIELREEYEMISGPRVQVRHIQLSSKEKAAEVRERLEAGEDFELLARKFSENQITAIRGGLLPPISRQDPAVTPLIREAAFQMKEGEVSVTIHEGDWYHVLEVERIFPASGIPFENADQEALRQRLVDRLVRSRQEDLEVELFQQARIDIRHQELRRQFERKHERSNRR